MNGTIKRVLALLLAAVLLLICAACRNADEKKDGEAANAAPTENPVTPAPTEPPKADPFDISLSIRVERTYKEGDSHYLYGLFPDGKTGFYQSMQPGVLPELRDLETGRVTKLTLGGYLKEDVEAMFRTAVVMNSKRYVADTAALEEKLASLNGLAIFTASPYALAMRYQPYAITSAQSDYLLLQDFNVGAGGMIDPKTGTLYNNFRTEIGSFEAVSAYGTKILFSMRPLGGAILDVSDLTLAPIEVNDAGFRPKNEAGYTSCTAMTFLSDGSIAAILSEQAFANNERTEQDWLFIVREDGGSEQYDLGTDVLSGNYRIVSNDPNYVIAAPAVAGLAVPRMVDRSAGAVTGLQISGFALTSVPLSEVPAGGAKENAVAFVDVLSDGRTILVQDRNSGSLALFRPDTMQTKLIMILDSAVYYCFDFCGDHRGRLCTSYLPRDGQAERGLLLTIVDDNGDPVF